MDKYYAIHYWELSERAGSSRRALEDEIHTHKLHLTQESRPLLMPHR